jgi:hypothetical protein
MNRNRLLVLTGLALTLGACTGQVSENGVTSSSASSEAVSSAEEIRETRNVSYQGRVQQAGMSMYMEGTHRLELEDGRFVLLESDELDLGTYVGKAVAVLGAVRPTVEGSAQIMRVEQITVLQTEESSSSSSGEEITASEASSSEAASSAAPVSSVAAVVASSSSKATAVVPAPSSVAAAVASSSFSSLAPVVPVTGNESDLTARVDAMAKSNLAESNWTQKYCSTHAGFCFPVHKNRWFISFGATTSYLWHVEISSEDFSELGEGPLVVNLVSGDLASVGAADGEVRTQGDFVIGYKAFNDKSHFEVSAPKKLEAEVRYLTSHIQAQ